MSKVEVSMPSPRFPIPQGTLDMLILQILSLDPAHGYALPGSANDPRAEGRRSSTITGPFLRASDSPCQNWSPCSCSRSRMTRLGTPRPHRHCLFDEGKRNSVARDVWPCLQGRAMFKFCFTCC